MVKFIFNIFLNIAKSGLDFTGIFLDIAFYFHVAIIQ